MFLLITALCKRMIRRPFQNLTSVLNRLMQHRLYWFKKHLKKFGFKSLIYYMFGIIGVCFVIIVGLVSSFTLALDFVANKLYEADGKIVNVDNVSNTVYQLRRPHPFTLGYQPPYYEHKYIRSPLEDVAFKCEYLVDSYKDAKPIYKSTTWRKNGSPLQIEDDRIQISVEIYKYNDSNKNKTEFRVFSMLQIKMIQESDFASYTCEYYNPLASAVFPGANMSRDFPKKLNDDTVHPMSPSPKCRCKPTYHTRETYVERYVCFSEFLLKKRKERVITKFISPGSLVTESSSYATMADVEDVDVEMKVKQGDDRSEQCCSIFLNWYDRLFDGGSFLLKFPLSHSKSDTKGLYIHISRKQCMCMSSFGTRNFTLYRRIINGTTGQRDTIEIVLPVKFVFIPDFSDSPSNRNKLEYTAAYNVTCFDNGFTTEDCKAYNFNSSFDQYIKSEKQSFYFWFGAVGAFHLMLLYILWGRCLRPISIAILYKGRVYVDLRSTIGGPVRILPGSLLVMDDSAQCQIFISYDEQNDYDKRVAQFIKDHLISQNLTVFDPPFDVSPGAPTLVEIQRAISNSSRFIVIVSESYQACDLKTLEYDSIQRVIKGQGCKMKERMFIIQTEDCDMQRFYLLPGMKVSEKAKDRNELDDASMAEFKKWEKTTKPLDKTNWTIHLAGLFKRDFYESLVYLFSLFVIITVRCCV